MRHHKFLRFSLIFFVLLLLANMASSYVTRFITVAFMDDTSAEATVFYALATALWIGLIFAAGAIAIKVSRLPAFSLEKYNNRVAHLCMTGVVLLIVAAIMRNYVDLLLLQLPDVLGPATVELDTAIPILVGTVMLGAYEMPNFVYIAAFAFMFQNIVEPIAWYATSDGTTAFIIAIVSFIPGLILGDLLLNAWKTKLNIKLAVVIASIVAIGLVYDVLLRHAG